MDDKIFILTAIDLELASYEFYDEWSQKVASPAARQMLIELRDIEKEHVKKLEELNSITETTELPDPDFYQYTEIEHKPLDEDSDLDNILAIALRMESKAYETYSRYAKKFKEDSYLRSFFTLLAEEERSHVRMIKTLIDEARSYSYKIRET